MLKFPPNIIGGETEKIPPQALQNWRGKNLIFPPQALPDWGGNITPIQRFPPNWKEKSESWKSGDNGVVQENKITFKKIKISTDSEVDYKGETGKKW